MGSFRARTRRSVRRSFSEGGSASLPNDLIPTERSGRAKFHLGLVAAFGCGYAALGAMQAQAIA